MRNLLVMLIYVLVSAFGLYRIKSAIGVFSTDFAIGFALYGLGFLIWMYILIRMPLSVAFPIAAGSLILATQVIGYFLLGEKISLLHGFGATSIIVGIALISVRT